MAPPRHDLPRLQLPQLKDPILLIHGLGAQSQYGPIDYFYKIPKLLRSAGNLVLIPALTPWQSIEYRAQELRTFIEGKFPSARKIHLIGHSMGGLDARYYASRLDPDQRVASVTTIGTPNHGTLLADLGLQALPLSSLRAVESLLGNWGSSAKGLEQLSTRYHREIFSQQAPDAPGVAYFSATSVIRGSLQKHALPQFWATHPVLQFLEGDNDGLVSEVSSRWGEPICTYSGDHYAQIGQILGRTRGLDHVAFFSEIVAHLKKRGF